MEKLTTDSQGMYFMRAFWRGLAGKKFDVEKTKILLYEAITLAIRSGMEFKRMDFHFINDWLREGALMDGVSPNTNIYSYACAYNNISACKAFEWIARFQPFMLERKRVYVGVSIKYEDREYLVERVGNRTITLRPRFFQSYSSIVLKLNEWQGNAKNIELINRVQY